MARPREFDSAEATDAAMRTFWVRGYEATSTAELQAATGLSSSSLYAAYGSKHGVLLHALDHYLEDRVPAMVAGMETDGAALAAVRDFFRMIARVSLDHPDEAARGCLCVGIAVELAGRDAEVVDRATSYRRRLRAVFAEALAVARDAGTVRDGVDISRVADSLVLQTIGLFATLRMGADAAEIAELVGGVEALLDTLEA